MAEPALTIPIRILHMSDIHLRGVDSIDQSTKKRIFNFVRGLTAESGLFTFLVVSGDLIDGPRFRWKSQKSSLEHIRAWLHALCDLAVGPNRHDHLIITPGNHDYRVSGLFRRRSAIDIFNQVFEQHMLFRRFDDERVIFACFDTNASTSHFDLATGTLHVTALDEYAEWLRQQANVEGYTRLAVFHHHPLPVANAEQLRVNKARVNLDDFLRLRNAGTILKRLLRHDFELILHGHLHAAEHWSIESAASSIADVESDPQRAVNRIDVLSAGTAGAATSDTALYSINTIELLGLGRVRVLQRDFADYGAPIAPKVLLKRGFEHSRPKEVVRRARLAELPLECSSTTREAIVTPRTGVTVMETHHSGLIRIPGRLITEFPVQTTADGMSAHPDVTARLLLPRVSLKVAVQPPLANAPSRAGHFTHMVDVADAENFEKPRELVYTQTCTGATLASAEQRGWLKSTNTKEHVGYRCRFRENLVQLNIYFSEVGPELVPSSFEVFVVDENGKRCTDEENSPCVVLTHHHPWIAGNAANTSSSDARLPTHVRANKPDVSLTIHRPLIGFTYRIRWALPDNCAHETSHEPGLRKLLSSPQKNGNRKRLEPLNEFCEGSSAALKSQLEQNSFELEPIDTGLYTFSPSNGYLKRWGTHTQHEGDGLPETVNWGRSIIGEAYRIRDGLLWVRTANDGRTDIPPGIASLYALPLWHGKQEFALSTITKEPLKEAPVAVVCFASYTSGGQMARFFGSSDRSDEWTAVNERLSNLFGTMIEAVRSFAG